MLLGITDVFDGVQQLQLDLVVITATFPRDIQLPGSRHDNDHLDITAIKILLANLLCIWVLRCTSRPGLVQIRAGAKHINGQIDKMPGGCSQNDVEIVDDPQQYPILCYDKIQRPVHAELSTPKKNFSYNNRARDTAEREHSPWFKIDMLDIADALPVSPLGRLTTFT